MNFRNMGIILLAASFLSGCATYKQLKPDPELSSKERGYIVLDDGGDKFEIKNGKKYFIKFPRPSEMNYYLIVSTPLKSSLISFLTDDFNDERKMVEMADKRGRSDSLSVFSVDTLKSSYYWIIDSTQKSTPLPLLYRYTPKWRFDFENKYDEYKSVLIKNTTDPDLYNKLNTKYDLSSIDYSSNISLTESKLEKLVSVNEQLNELQKIFPATIAQTKDSAYTNYLALRKNTVEEIDFQNKYIATLTVLKDIVDSKGSYESFISHVSSYLEFYDNIDKYPSNISALVKKELVDGLKQTSTFYNDIIDSKEDAKKFDLTPEYDLVDQLYRKVNHKIDNSYESLSAYILKFNDDAIKCDEADSKIEEILIKFQNTPSWPNNEFYSSLESTVSDLRNQVPKSSPGQYSKYASKRSTIQIEKRIADLRKKSNYYYEGVQIGATVVPLINAMKQAGNYKGIIRTLMANKNYDFLLEQYSDVDNTYINSVTNNIANNLRQNNFVAAESSLRSLWGETEFINPSQSIAQKQTTVQNLETSLFEQVKNASKARVDAFALKNEATIDNVPGLYKDSVFTPVYDLTFASGGETVLTQRRSQIQDYLTNIKYVNFPETAIKKLYAEFQRNVYTRGVDKARAIAIHGRNYKGNDQNTRFIAAECDVYLAKWIVSPKAFRRVLALPITDNRNGVNEYMFQLVLRIPSDAEFPVFDINIKLPAEIAKNAGTNQWYEWMTINGKMIKNEGRVRVTSPNPSNDYTFQVSPIQMDKNGNNILEVRFKYPDFRVFEVSVMAQEPLLKKN